MARTGIKLLVLLGLALAFIIVPQYAAAQCVIGYANGFAAPGPQLSSEGLKERPADVSISTGAVNCFSAGNVITVTYNGILSAPATLTNSSFPQYIVISNPNSAADGTLTLGVTTTSGISSSGPQTVIQLTVLGATTDPVATVALQNLRFDVNGLAASQTVPTVMNAFASGSSAGLTAVSHVQVGGVLSTISITAPNYPAVSTGSGQQSSGGPLTTQALFSFADAPGWGVSAFRVANAKPAYPVGCGPTPPAPVCTDTVDNPTTATSLVLDVESIPSGVTVTFPSTISIWPGVNATVPTFQWKLRNTASGAGVAQAIYDTVVATGSTFLLKVTTGATAADSTAGTSAPAVLPTLATVGVQISSASGSGTAQLRVVFGPGGNPPGVTGSAAFAGDDFNAAATPNYTPFISTAGVGREIITDSVINTLTGTDTAPTNWFTIAPTQSAVLFQYATDLDGYNTGLAVTNTGNDSTIFKTKGQTGPVTWYLFANGAAAPIIYTTKATDGTGLDKNGNLAPGNTLAITLDELLKAAGQTTGTFSGYVIALGQFNYGHGFDIIVDSSGRFTGINALFLGGAFRVDTLGEGLLQ